MTPSHFKHTLLRRSIIPTIAVEAKLSSHSVIGAALTSFARRTTEGVKAALDETLSNLIYRVESHCLERLLVEFLKG